ncbi:MAG: CehA/McbA family metallohydrolase [Anditalea sp.]
MKNFCCLCIFLLFSLNIQGQHHHETALKQPEFAANVEAQPFLAQALRVGEALSAIGSALPSEAINQLQALKHLPYDRKTVEKVQEILDPYCLAVVDINPESRVSVTPGLAQPILVQDGWTTFLVKVQNQAHITAALVAESPHSQPVLHRSTSSPRMKEENKLTPGQLDNRFLQLSMYQERPLKPNLSGLGLEYAVIQLYTREKGKREVQIGFNVGQGTQDIGFRNTIDILFAIKPAVKVIFNVRDEDNSPTMASFIITDGIERFGHSKERITHPWRYPWLDWEEPETGKSVDTVASVKKLRGIYPLPSKRLAGRDKFPDFFFQPQIYRGDGEYITLPPGNFHVIFGRGPEYQVQQQEIIVPENSDSIVVSFRPKRWIHMAALGWYSADHHIHASGCSHYESPEEGVLPEHMWRQIQGEDLNLGSNLTWGPSWYHQKQYFTGKDHPLSDQHNILRYDIEVSGFPSSHAGHLALLNLKEDDFPNTTKIEEWPSWTLPVLQWAKEQGGVTGYAHAGWGLAPMNSEHTPYTQEGYSTELPNYITPRMDGIGANEYVVTVTHDVVDFYTELDISVKAAAFLSEIQDEKGKFIASRAPNQQPYWNIERARIDSSRKIPVELIVNGYPVEEKEITADGNWQNLKFNYKIEKSSWLAIRVYASAHTNPIFVIVDGKPIRDKKSAIWCREAVDQCWKMKHGRIRGNELDAAQEAYDYARKVYDRIILSADDREK